MLSLQFLPSWFIQLYRLSGARTECPPGIGTQLGSAGPTRLVEGGGGGVDGGGSGGGGVHTV